MPVDDFRWRNYLDRKAYEWFANDFDYESEEDEIYRQLCHLTEPIILRFLGVAESVMIGQH